MSDPHNRRTNPHQKFGLESARSAEKTRREASTVHDHHDHQTPEESIDHLASIYEHQADQFEAVVPFVRRGLERGERCLYIADDNSTETVVNAFRAGGIDVDSARESGALSIHTKADTYLRTGEFDREAMLEFWRELLTDARDTEGYTGVRAAAEMTWALDEDDGTSLDRLVEYEALLNDLYAGDDYVVLCQYDRERFPAAILSDVIRTHPLIVSDGTLCRNFYYYSPDEFFAADRPPVDVDRTVDGLVSRARTRHALEESDQHLRTRLHQHEVVADLSQQGLEHQDLDSLLADVTERVADTLDVEHCSVFEVLPDGEEVLLREGVGWRDELVGTATIGTGGDHNHDHDSHTSYTLRSEEPVVVDDLATESRFSGSDLLAEHDVTSAVGVSIGSPGEPWGVLGVYARDRRAFSEHDATFVQSVANTVATAIDRAERERDQRELYELTSSPGRSFESKLQALFDLGCERFDLDLGGLARIDPRADLFEVEYVSDDHDLDHDHLEPGGQVALSETYCRVHTTEAEPTGITDPTEAGFDGSAAYEEFGVRSYLGTRLGLENDFDRTLFFVSSDPQDTAFSEDERTFLSLMGQWVQYELERRQYERRLEESNERLEQFAYAASHDLQEPLRMVSSYLQLIEARYADELDEDGEEFIDFAVDGADRMREMIGGLLEYSRVETQGNPLEPVSLETVFDDVLADLQFQIDETDAEITVEDLPRVEGDASQLRQLFQNLLGNAIEYSGDDPPRIDVAAERTRGNWLISVRDEGIGIEPDDQDRIFEVFQRLHSHDEHASTGIGLALCERIVERHGGEIWVDSEPGEGATFSFTLPPVNSQDT